MFLQSSVSNIIDEQLKQEWDKYGVAVSFEAGETIMRSGQKMDSFPLLLSGTIKIIRESDNAELLLYHSTAKDWPLITLAYGFEANSYKSIITAVAAEKVQCLFIPMDKNCEWLINYPSWRKLSRLGYQYHLTKMMKLVDQVAFGNINQRLAQYIIDKSNRLNSKQLEITHQEVAKDLNTSRETVSRLLKRLEEDGLVVLGRNKITLVKDSMI